MIVGVIDTETSGKLDPAHRIIELSIHKWDATAIHSPRLLSERTWRIHPERSIEPKAFAVHGISLDDLAGEKNLAHHTEAILADMQGVDLWVAQNGDSFDRPFIRLEYERVLPAALPFLDGQKWFDTMLEGRWATAWGKSPNLGELAWACDVDYDPTKAHAADYDVRVTAKCFFFGLRHGFYKLA